jgi:hypothetical protein
MLTLRCLLVQQGKCHRRRPLQHSVTSAIAVTWRRVARKEAEETAAKPTNVMNTELQNARETPYSKNGKWLLDREPHLEL